MSHAVRLLILTVTALACGAVSAAEPAGFWTTPTIKGYGKMHWPAHAAYAPDPSQSYRIVFTLTDGPRAPDQVNPSLDRVARTVNLYTAAGVPLSHLKFVAIAYGPATDLALDDAHYRARFHSANPNLPLIRELRQAGVDVAVCAQAVAFQHVDYSWIDKSVTLALSGLTTVTVLEHSGYVLMPM